MSPPTRTAILEAADQIFGAVGFDAASTRQIAEESGVNKALIHYHFGSKDELFGAVLDRYYGQLGEALGEALGDTAAGPGGLRTALHRAVEIYVDFLAANPGFSRIVQREASGGRHLGRIVAHTLPMFEHGCRLLRERLPTTAAGELAAPQLLVSFYGMVVSYFSYSEVLDRMLPAPALSAEGLAARKQHLGRMLDLLLDSLEAGTPATAPPETDATRRRNRSPHAASEPRPGDG